MADPTTDTPDTSSPPPGLDLEGADVLTQLSALSSPQSGAPPAPDLAPDLAQLGADRSELAGEQSGLDSQMSALTGQAQKQQAAAGTDEGDVEKAAAARAGNLTQTFNQKPPQANPLQGIAPLLLIAAFGGKASKLDAGSMLAATTGMVTGYLQGKDQQFQQSQKQYEQAYKQFMDRQEQMDKMYAIYEDAYKGRLDYQQKALDATLRSMDEVDTKRRMTVQDKARIDEQVATLKRQNAALTDQNYFKQANQKIQQDKLKSQLSAMSNDPKAMTEMAKAIANYDIPMPNLSGFSLRSPQVVSWYNKLLDQVKATNPDFKQPLYQQAQRARIAFTSGRQGDSVRAFDVVVNHLDKLDKMSDALKNSDWKTFNSLRLTLQGQASVPAVSNYQAGMQIIGNEVIKATTGGPAALADRDTVQQKVAQNFGPQAIKGVIDTYKDLAGGQLDGLRRQYEAGALSNTFAKDLHLSPEASSLMDRANSGGSPAAAGPKEGDKTTSKSGRSMIFQNGNWHYVQ